MKHNKENLQACYIWHLKFGSAQYQHCFHMKRVMCVKRATDIIYNLEKIKCVTFDSCKYTGAKDQVFWT